SEIPSIHGDDPERNRRLGPLYTVRATCMQYRSEPNHGNICDGSDLWRDDSTKQGIAEGLGRSNRERDAQASEDDG
ncbi:hypothetical protein ADUPG1_005794, partial [Aduncisulcus paluster]